VLPLMVPPARRTHDRSFLYLPTEFGTSDQKPIRLILLDRSAGIDVAADSHNPGLLERSPSRARRPYVQSESVRAIRRLVRRRW
jgi:hypothetical protein